MKDKEICWNITARCNQNCKYCHRFLKINDLSYNENLSILKTLKDSGINSITWTGGEALLFNGIDELLKYSYELGIKNKIITNGKLLTTNRIDKIHKYLDSITLSIDSTDSDVNDYLGRGRNHFEEVREILDYIKKKNCNVKIRINSVVCKNNINTLKELTEFLNNYEIYSWRIFKFMPLRETAVLNKKMFEISLNDYYDAIENIKQKSNIVNIDTRVEKDMEKKYVLILANGNIVVTKDGKDEKVGNALVDSLKKFI